MNEFSIKKASRQGIKPLIVYYAESGCGKTFTALLTARGMVGKSGKIVVVDTESGRASLYSDIPAFAPYETLELSAPFAPARYVSALEAVQQAGADIVIIDSGSHEHEGTGGVLDMAMENEHRSGRAGLHNWKLPKFEHAKFVAAIIRSKIPVIVCLRAKFKTRQGKDEKGKTVIIKDDHTSPIQAEDFIFEATCHGEIMPDHSLRLTKWSHPTLKECFPVNAPMELKHGEAIARWCEGKPAAFIPPLRDGQTPTKKDAETLAGIVDKIAPDPLKTAKSKLWSLALKYVGAGSSLEEVEAALNRKQIAEKPLAQLTSQEIEIAIEKLEIELLPA